MKVGTIYFLKIRRTFPALVCKDHNKKSQPSPNFHLYQLMALLRKKTTVKSFWVFFLKAALWVRPFGQRNKSGFIDQYFDNCAMLRYSSHKLELPSRGMPWMRDGFGWDSITTRYLIFKLAFESKECLVIKKLDLDSILIE